jgi:hypothetical protein
MKKESFMKKLGIAAVLLAAGVVAASGVFAQELKFDGLVNTGIGVIVTDAQVEDGTDTKAADIKVVPFGVDAGQAGYRFRLNGAYTSEGGNYGAKFRFQAQSNFALGAFSLPYAYGWASFLNQALTVTGGLVDDGTWATGGSILGAVLGGDVGEGLGVLVKVSPIPGLDLGVGAYLISPQGGGANNTIIIPAGERTTTTTTTTFPITNQDGSTGTGTITETVTRDPSTTAFSGYDVPLDRLKYTVGVGYTQKDLFKVTANFRTANQTVNAVSRFADADDEAFSGDETSKLIFGAQLLAIKDLTAVIEAAADKLEDTGVDREKDNIDLNFYETLGYKLGDLSFGLDAVQYLKIEKDVDHDLGLQFNPWVSYAIGSIVPRLDLTYFLAGKATTTPSYTADAAALGTNYHRVNAFAYADNGEDTDDVSVIGVRPSVKFNVGKSFIEIGDFITYALGPEGSFKDAEDDKKSSSLNNVFYVDFKWVF